MIGRIKAFLARPAAARAAGRHGADELQVAAAALLVEAARMDQRIDAAERRTIERLVRERFGLRREEADELIAEAEAAAARSSQLFAFTRAVKDGFDHDERVALIEMLWDVVYADGALHDYEANLLRRVAGLIHVPDRDSGAARQRVLARHQAAGRQAV